jgi:hypothetical protein
LISVLAEGQPVQATLRQRKLFKRSALTNVVGQVRLSGRRRLSSGWRGSAVGMNDVPSLGIVLNLPIMQRITVCVGSPPVAERAQRRGAAPPACCPHRHP